MRRLATAAIVAALLGGITSVPSSAAPATKVRVGGTDNVSTAIAWSQLRFSATSPLADYGTTSRSAILARDDSFADALAAGALAAALGAPFLVTATNDLDDRVVAELERVEVEHVLIIGGTAAVSPAVETELGDLGYRTQRLAGADRIATAVKVATDAERADGTRRWAVGYTQPTLARAFGNGSTAFADSLGGGMLAQGGPLLVTETPLSPAVESYIADYIAAFNAGQEERGTSYYADVSIAGGTAAVGQSVQDRIIEMGGGVSRFAGVNRFATAAAITQRTFIPDTYRNVALVDGYHLDSWVSGFAFPVFYFGGLLLSNGAELPQETRDELARMAGMTTEPINLYCAPQVPAPTCDAADAILNG